jgi:hypothetical protein
MASIFGSKMALGNDPEDALGHLIGSQIGDAAGLGGLGPLGTGSGGGGTGQNTLGGGSLEHHRIDRSRFGRRQRHMAGMSACSSVPGIP